MNRLVHKDRIGTASIIVLYFALKPLYLRESGTIQLADLVLLISVPFLILHSRGNKWTLSRIKATTISIFLVMIIYQASINGIWSLVTGAITMNRATLYYVFNCMAFCVCLYINDVKGTKILRKAVAIGCFISVIVTAIGLLFFKGTRLRSTGFFNNPNQLGYYAVIMVTIVVLCNSDFTKLQKYTVIGGTAWFTIASLSKAAIVAFFAEIIVLILLNNKSNRRQLGLQIAMLIVVAFVLYLLFFSDSSVVLSNRTLYSMRYRMLHMQQENDSDFGSGRGYSRVFEMLPHLLWGTGQGAYDRFISKHGSEVHSTFVALLTCYGLIGFVGYFTFFMKCLGTKRQAKRNCAILIGVLLYSLTHNGIRNTLLWLLLGLMVCINEDMSRLNLTKVRWFTENREEISRL